MKQRVLIQDFISECYKLCDDAAWVVDEYLIKRHPNSKSKNIQFDDAILIMDKLIEESNVPEVVIKSFRDGVKKLFEKDKPIKYERGIMYASCQYIGKY